MRNFPYSVRTRPLILHSRVHGSSPMAARAEPQRIGADAQSAADACATYILDTLSERLKSQPRATLAISGGKTPGLLFSTLAKSGFDWSNVHFFWVDERCVPPSDDQSNFKLANETLL